EKWLKAALEINPRQIKARQFLGQLQMQSGRFTEAVETFNVLLKQELNLDDVIASAHLNLAKIALVRRQWNQAEKHFKEVGKSPERGDRATAEKGLLLGSRLRKTGLWNREQTPRLDVYFSPKIDGDAAWRKNWVETRDRALQRMYERVKWTIPEPIPVYVYFNNDDCYEITGQETAHTFRYSWWLVHTLQDATPGHDLAHQVVSRAWGSRPATVPLVEGFCDLLDGTAADRHAEARKLAAAGKLRSLVDLHARQKEEEGMGAASRSFVAFAVAEYGIEKFIESFRNYNLVLLDPKYKVEGVKNVYKWPEALDEVFRRGLGESLAVVEGKWKKSLQ
ncbi:MAG TPA: hypothetical protein VEI02_02045, partial [Planctomycetota bacterium]|nr:hypothetical protein [Planctomycetota bacterium]